jgi:mannosyltransferase
MSASDGVAERMGWPSVRATVRTLSLEKWLLLAVIAVAAAIRIVLIDTQSFWSDEALTSYEVRLRFGAMLGTVVHVETTPPLYFVVAWIWAKLFGGGEVALRSISVIAGVGLVPIAYVSARELSSRWAGLLAATFVAVNPFLLWYSQEARAYMLLAALSGASFMWFVLVLRNPTRGRLVWWAGFSAAAVMTHFFAGFLVLPEAAWLLFRLRSRGAAVAVAVVAFVQAAMLPFAVLDTNSAHGAGWIARIPLRSRLYQTISEWTISNLYHRTTATEVLLAGLLTLLIVVALLVFAGDRRERRGALVAGALAACVFVLPLLLGALGYDYFFSRNLLPAFVPVVVVLAIAFTRPRAWGIGAALATILLALFVYGAVEVQTQARFQRPDWRRVAQSLGAAPVPRAILAADGTTADSLKIYLPGVHWVQPKDRPVTVREIDVVGATKRLPIESPVTGHAEVERVGALRKGRPVPQRAAPPGTTLLVRYRVANWIVARFQLARPMRVSLNQLAELAPRYFLHTPSALLIFTQAGPG